MELSSDEVSKMTDAFNAENNVEALLPNDEIKPEMALVIGLLNNPELQAEFRNLGIAHAELKHARSLHNPKVEIMVRESDDHDANTNVEFTIVQDVVDLLLQPSRVNLSNIELEQTKLKLIEKGLNLVLMIRKNVLSYQAEEAKSNTLEKIYEATQAASELALLQHETGNISDLELAFQQMAHQQFKLGLTRQNMATSSARNLLNRKLGLWGEQARWKLTEGLPDLPQEDFSFGDLESQAINRNLALAALNLENKALRQRLSLARKMRVTDLEAGFNTEKEPEGERLTGGLVEFGLPVFDRNQGQIAKLDALILQNHARTAALAIEIRSKIALLFDRLTMIRAQLQYYQKSVMPLRKKIVDLSQRHYNAMFIGTYELLQAKQNELSAQLEYFSVLRDYWHTYYDVKHILAGGIVDRSPADLSSTTTTVTSRHREH